MLLKCDISSKENVDAVVKTILQRFKKIDVLINNAGIVNGKSFLSTSTEEIGRVMGERKFIKDLKKMKYIKQIH